jgi:hypothetical protein
MPAQTKQQPKQKPVHRIRSGALSVSIWAREHEGVTYYTANAQRAYTKDDGQTWEHSDSFGRDELLAVGQLLTSAWHWIKDAEAEAKQS